MSPAYQPYGPRDAVPPPFYSRGGSFLVLLLEGNQEQLEALVKTMLNDPAEGAVSYTVPSKWIAMQVGSYESLGSRAPGFVSDGVAPETSIAFWVPLLASKAGAKYVALNAPFVYVDQPMSLSSGREVFGYPKSLGRFTPEVWNGTGMQMSAFGGRYFANSRATWGPLIELLNVSPKPVADVLAVAGALGLSPPPVESATQVAETLSLAAGVTAPDGSAKLSGEPWETIERFVAMLEGTMRQAFLKQFRDVKGSTEAVYREVIEADGKVNGPSFAISLDTWQLRLNQQDNHPIATELGLAPVQQTKLAFTMAMDIELLPGEVVAP